MSGIEVHDVQFTENQKLKKRKKENGHISPRVIKTVEREPAPPYLQQIILFVQLQYTLKTVLIPKGEMDSSIHQR